MRLFCISISLSLASCINKTPPPSVYKTTGSIIIDSAIAPKDFLTIDQGSGYPIYYLGPPKNTIRIGRQYRGDQVNPEEKMPPGTRRTYSNRTLKLFVDTSIRLNSPLEYLSTNRGVARDSTKNYHSFLFSVKNISGGAIYLGPASFLYYISREAKDKKGNWVQIEKKPCEEWHCLTGETDMVLKKGELLISKVKRYKGNFVTEFRLAFGQDKNVVYSNTWKDSIDERTLANKKIQL